jgi:hypothetical protein
MGRLAVAGLLVLSFLAGSLFAEEEPAIVSVTVASGRVFTGIPDRRTNADQLWLRSGIGQLSLARPIAWSAIVEVRQAEVVLTNDEVREVAQSDDGSQPVAAAVRHIEPGKIVILQPIPPAAVPSANLASSQPVLVPTTLRIDAAVDNFDGDTENDGLAVELRLLDQRGQPAAYEGSARIVWLGPQAVKNTAQSPPKTVVLGDWTMPVVSDGSYKPVIVTLPFQSRDPERDISLWNYSFVQATVTVPGVGNFTAERDGVRIRRWEPFRDYNQVNTPLTNRSSRRP